jgi:hypothetical protein
MFNIAQPVQYYQVRNPDLSTPSMKSLRPSLANFRWNWAKFRAKIKRSPRVVPRGFAETEIVLPPDANLAMMSQRRL